MHKKKKAIYEKKKKKLVKVFCVHNMTIIAVDCVCMPDERKYPNHAAEHESNSTVLCKMAWIQFLLKVLSYNNK